MNQIKNLQYNNYRIPPTPLTSQLTTITSSIINPSILGCHDISKGLILDLHEIIEGNIDESLILMNESGLEENHLRKVLVTYRKLINN